MLAANILLLLLESPFSPVVVAPSGTFCFGSITAIPSLSFCVVVTPALAGTPQSSTALIAQPSAQPALVGTPSASPAITGKIEANKCQE